MRYRLALVVALSAITASCDSGPATPTTAPPGVPTTTTTIPADTCGLLAADTAEYLEILIAVLDEATLAEVRDRAAWPEALAALELQGHDLDARAEAMRCDPAEIQTMAFRTAELDPDSELARYLLTLLGQG